MTKARRFGRSPRTEEDLKQAERRSGKPEREEEFGALHTSWLTARGRRNFTAFGSKTPKRDSKKNVAQVIEILYH